MSEQGLPGHICTKRNHPRHEGVEPHSKKFQRGSRELFRFFWASVDVLAGLGILYRAFAATVVRRRPGKRGQSSGWAILLVREAAGDRFVVQKTFW